MYKQTGTSLANCEYSIKEQQELSSNFLKKLLRRNNYG